MTAVFATPLSGSGMVLAVLCAGPNWTALDGTRTLGTVEARANGRMAGVTSEQRINTEGGNAPARGCKAQAEAGQHIGEGCAADDVFFTATFR